VSAEMDSYNSLKLTFDKAIESSSVKRGDFKFFSTLEIGIDEVLVNQENPEELSITLSEVVTPENYISISYFPGNLEGTDGSKVNPFGPEGISNPLHDVIDVNSASLEGFYYQEGFGPSESMKFLVSGELLVGNIVLSTTTDFEISLDSSQNYSSSITLYQSNGKVADTEVYVRMKPGLLQDTHIGEISIRSTASLSKSLTLAGEVTAGPELSVSEFDLGDFTYYLGSGPSEYKSFNVSGMHLRDGIVLFAPEHFEISESIGSEFGTEIHLPHDNSLVPETPLYVRLKSGLEVGAYEGDLSLNTSGLELQTVSLTGNVVQATGIDGSLESGTKVVSIQYYDLLGHRIYEPDNYHGIYIVKKQLSDGSISVVKVFKENY
jgi:hypothetical protein